MNFCNGHECGAEQAGRNPNFRDHIVATKDPVFWLDPGVPEEAGIFTKILKTVQPSTPALRWFPQGHKITGVTLYGQNATVVVAADFHGMRRCRTRFA